MVHLEDITYVYPFILQDEINWRKAFKKFDELYEYSHDMKEVVGMMVHPKLYYPEAVLPELKAFIIGYSGMSIEIPGEERFLAKFSRRVRERIAKIEAAHNHGFEAALQDMSV